MSRQRRTFTPEFKREAASLVLDQGYSHADAAHSLGLVESALRRWVNQPAGTRRCHTDQQSADSRAAENPGTGSPNQPPGTRETDCKKKATALLMAEEHERLR
jgi:transposase